jgi:Na+-transporting methylmalonyl-CoA/oxaloacetate decarboxylase gamma subunit
MAPLPFAFVVHGIAAVLIILVILAVIVLGLISLLRLSARGAKKVADKVGTSSREQP